MFRKSSFIFKLLLFICFAIFFNVHCFAQSDPVESLIKTGQDHFNLFQYEKALDNFKKAADMAPKNWEANFLAGKTLIKLRRLDEAEKYLSKAYSANPMDVDLQKTLGALYINFAKTAQNNGQTSKKNEYQMKACHVFPGATKVWQTLFESWTVKTIKK